MARSTSRDNDPKSKNLATRVVMLRSQVALIALSKPPPSIELENGAFCNSRTATKKRGEDTVGFDFEKPMLVTADPGEIESPRWRTSTAEAMERNPPHFAWVRP